LRIYREEEFEVAFLQMDVFSTMLSRRTEVGVILPERHGDCKEYPVLWLLHGATGNFSDWWRHSSIELYAEKYGIAVVMPSADNSFYANIPTGRYYSYIADELPEKLGAMFPISLKREKNIVGGLSMGGHGAYKFGLTSPEQYAGVCILSSGNFVELGDAPQDSPHAQIHKYVFGTTRISELAGTEHDIKYLAEQAAQSGNPLPKLFVCCGTEDGGFANAKGTFQYLTETLGFEGEWHEGPGIHDWLFWGGMLPKMMSWCESLLSNS